LDQILRGPAEASAPSGASARARLAELIGNFAAAEAGQTARLKAENAQLRAELDHLRSASPQPEPPQPPQPNNVVPISDGAARANANKPPAHYLKEHDDGGALVATWTPPGGLDAIARGEGQR
jgi:hypothetical protein